MGTPQKLLLSLFDREWSSQWKKSFYPEVVPGSLWTPRVLTREEEEEAEGVWPWLMVRWLRDDCSEVELERIFLDDMMMNDLIYKNGTDLVRGDLIMVVKTFDHVNERDGIEYRHARVLFRGRIGDLIYLRPEDWLVRLQRVL